MCLISLIYSTRAGIHIFEFFDHYAVGINLIFFLMLQTMVLGWWVGFDTIQSEAMKEGKEKFCFFFKYFA